MLYFLNRSYEGILVISCDFVDKVDDKVKIIS